jgi:hypothetical protein
VEMKEVKGWVAKRMIFCSDSAVIIYLQSALSAVKRPRRVSSESASLRTCRSFNTNPLNDCRRDLVRDRDSVCRRLAIGLLEHDMPVSDDKHARSWT